MGRGDADYLVVFWWWYRYMPYVGYVTIALNDYRKLKYALLGLMGLSLLFQKES